MLDYTEHLFSGVGTNDEALEGYVLACDRLIDIAIKRGDYKRCSELALLAIERIHTKISSQGLSQDYFNILRYQQEEFATSYMNALSAHNTRPGDHLEIFAGAFKLVLSGVTIYRHIELGCRSLKIWWSDVENRPIIDLVACDILQNQLKRLSQIKNLTNSNCREASKIFDLIDQINRDLSFKAARLRSKTA